MSALENFSLLLGEINDAMGQEFALDENNGFSFLCLDVMVSVTFLPESGTVILSTKLGALGEDENADARADWFLRENDGLLGSNGFTYALDESDGTVWLSDRREVGEIGNADAFAAWVDRLVSTAHKAWDVTDWEFPYVDDDDAGEGAE